MIRIKRIYESADRTDGFRILVDRLWPRDLSKNKARVDLWLKEVSPSKKLRKWYGHDPEKWEEFRREYQAELRDKKEFAKPIKQAEMEHGRVTLLFAAKDPRRNNAAVLLRILRRGGKIVKNWKPSSTVCLGAAREQRR